MSSWLNFAAFALPRNATTGHTVTPSSATGLTNGAAFTPTAGRLLVLVIGSSAYVTTGPSGWTAPTGGSAQGNTGLYVYYRTAAGSDTPAVVHNASNFPAGAAIFEFPAGSTFVSAASAINQTLTAANPTLSSLTGSNVVFGAACDDVFTTGSGSATWSSPNAELVDSFIAGAATDGYWFGLAGQDPYASATYAPTPTITVSGGTTTTERLTFAVNVPGGTDATVTAVADTATGDVPSPAVSASSTIAGTPAAAIGAMPAPAVTASGGAVVAPPAAQGTGDAPNPAVSAGSTIASPAAAGTGDVPSANMAISSEVDTGPASGTGGIPAPAVSGGSGSSDATVDPPPADGSGGMPAPAVTAGANIAAPPADGTGAIPAPAVSGDQPVAPAFVFSRLVKSGIANGATVSNGARGARAIAQIRNAHVTAKPARGAHVTAKPVRGASVTAKPVHGASVTAKPPREAHVIGNDRTAG